MDWTGFCPMEIPSTTSRHTRSLNSSNNNLDYNVFLLQIHNLHKGGDQTYKPLYTESDDVQRVLVTSQTIVSINAIFFSKAQM